MKCRLEPSSSPEREELQRQLESLQLDVRRLQLEHASQLAVNEHRVVILTLGFNHSLVQQKTYKDFPRRAQSH